MTDGAEAEGFQHSRPRETPPGLVSIVIVNRDERDLLSGCLRSVYAQFYRPIEVVVVDNGSADDSVRMIQQQFPQVRIVVNESNKGFAEGNNQGVEAASGDVVVLLNNDTVVENEWLVRLVEALRKPGIGAVTSRVVTEGVPARFYERNGTINYIGYNIMREFEDLSMIFFAGGASLAFCRDVVGTPFPDEYFLYQEDVYLSWRLRLMGYSVAMVQESVVHHKGSVSTRKQPRALVTFFQERNRMLNSLLFYEMKTLLILLPYFLFDGLVKLILSVFARRKSLLGIVRSYLWLIWHLSWIRNMRSQLQNMRKVKDKDIMKLMSSKVVDGDALPARLLNGLSRLYARAVGLPYYG